jgi:hypothetical protein
MRNNSGNNDDVFYAHTEVVLMTLRTSTHFGEPCKVVMSTKEEDTYARHRKELKALDGEKRSAFKKAKSTAGKKAKVIVEAYVNQLVVSSDYYLLLRSFRF